MPYMTWFTVKNHIFANEQKWHVGKLKSWVIITSPHVERTLIHFYGCHSNGALRTILSVLLDFSSQYICRAFLKSAATNGASNVLHYAGSVPTFTWWQRKSNKADNNWHSIGDSLPLFHGEWGFQKLIWVGDFFTVSSTKLI